MIRLLVIIALCAGLARAAPVERELEPAPVIEASGPVRLGHYTKPFAVAEPSKVTRDYAARHTHLTPWYGSGCGWWGWSGWGWWGWGWRGCGPIIYTRGPYFPSY